MTALICTLLLLVQPAPPAKAVGMIQLASGKVEVKRAKATLPGRTMDQIHLGDQVSVAVGGSASVVFFSNGHRYRLPPKAQVTLGKDGFASKAGPQPVTLKPIDQKFLRSLGAQGGPSVRSTAGPIVRGTAGGIVRGDPRIGPKDPDPVGAVRHASPTLKWAGLVEGDSLRIRIRVADRTVLERSLPRTARSFVVPSGTLKPGTVFSWNVAALDVAGVGKWFDVPSRVLTEAELTAIVQAERFLGQGDEADRLLLVALYESLGLWSDAWRVIEPIAKAHSDDHGLTEAALRVKAMAANYAASD